MTENELKIKLQEFGFESKDGVEWTRYLFGIGRIGIRFSQEIYKSQEVRVATGHKMNICDMDDTYGHAYHLISKLIVESTLTS